MIMNITRDSRMEFQAWYQMYSWIYDELAERPDDIRFDEALMTIAADNTWW